METIMNNRFFIYPTIVALTTLMFAASAMAEPPRGKGQGGEWHHGPPGAEQQLARLDQALELSDEQSAELLAVLQAADAEREALHERVMAQFRPEICALMLETDADVIAVLTPEQAEAFQQMKEERRQRKDGGWGGHMAGFGCYAVEDDS
jgi:Spy/CpxP family protein refolding chaperone